ncbi:hypothetical protein Tco_1031667 [Tanacetum coccineum]|uniref:Uncharacterized protein n=1 Tax=Tanacetum coccineum TaxID=301880 RepID=A0ABQ5GA16_9ASTR
MPRILIPLRPIMEGADRLLIKSQADYPATRGDDDDDAEEEHLAPADPAAVAYSADQDPYLAYRVTARMSIRPQAPAPFLSEEVAERLLALPTPPPAPLSPYSSPLSSAGIRQRDALPSPIHETEMPEMCLPLRKRPCRTTPFLLRGRESSATVPARQSHPGDAPTTPRGVNQRVIEVLDTTMTRDMRSYILIRMKHREVSGGTKIVKSRKLNELTSTQQGPAKDPSEPEPTKGGQKWHQKKAHKNLQVQGQSPQTPPPIMCAEIIFYNSTPVKTRLPPTSVTSAQLQAMIDEGVTAVWQHVLQPVMAMIT